MIQNGRMPGGTVDVGIYLGGRNALMPKHFLNKPDVSPVLYKMSRKGMPEGVRGYLLPYSGKRGHLPDSLECRNATEGIPIPVYEHELAA